MLGMGADEAPGWLGCLPSVTWDLWHLGCVARSRDSGPRGLGRNQWARTVASWVLALDLLRHPRRPYVVPTSSLITPQSKGGGVTRFGNPTSRQYTPTDGLDAGRQPGICQGG